MNINKHPKKVIWITQYLVPVNGNGSFLGLVTKLVHSISIEVLMKIGDFQKVDLMNYPDPGSGGFNPTLD